MRKCMIALFFAILLMPGVLGALLGRAAEGQNTENRTLAERPELSFENLEDFPADAEAYINDHAPFRDQFIDAYASMNMELFHSIDNNDVIVGKEDWLFYAGNDSRVDALGISPFTEVEQWSITTQLLQIRQKYGKDRDSFVFFIAPDKEIVYRQYLPDYYAPVTDTSRAKELVKYIRENSDIQVIYPLEDLLAASEQGLTYYKTDTHWNDYGGFVGSQELIAALGGRTEEVRFAGEAEETASSGEGEAAGVRVSFAEGERGDLGNLGHTPMRYLDEVKAQIEGYYDELTPELLEDNPETGITRARTEGAPDERRLVMVRDSFTEAMEPVLQKYFAESVLIDWESIESTDIGSYGGDVLVYQVVERNLGRIPADLVSILENGS